jgi:hypothetical protein
MSEKNYLQNHVYSDLKHKLRKGKKVNKKASEVKRYFATATAQKFIFKY